MKNQLAVAAMVLIALASGAGAQENPPQGFRVWVGPSLGNRDYELGKQLFSALGITKDISPRQNESLQVFLDAFRIVERPAEVLPRVIKEEIVGLGLARLFPVTDKSGLEAYYGFGLGYYHDRRSDSFPQTPITTTNTLGMKLMLGMSTGSAYFIQAQFTYLSGRNDFQFGVGRKF